MSENRDQTLEKLITTLSYLDANTKIWNRVPIVCTYRDHLADAVGSLQEEMTNQSNSSDFSGSTLQQLRITIAEKMDILDDILEAYADDIADKKLLDEAENSKSDYLRLTNDGFERKVTTILQLLDKHKEQLGNYGLTQEQVADVKANFDAYKEKRTQPQISQKSKEPNSQQFQLLLDEGISIYDRLGKVMVRFRTSNSSFYNGFKAIDLMESTTS